MRLKKIVNEAKKFEWKHHNIILLVLSIFIAYYLVKTPAFIGMIESAGNFGYLGRFLPDCCLPTASRLHLRQQPFLFWGKA